MMRATRWTAALAGAVVMTMTASTASAATVVTVSGDGQAGWLFNRDTSTSTPYEFTAREASIGSGSLYVRPIVNVDPKDKFIAEQFVDAPAGDFAGVSYDFLVDSDPADYVHFYLNVYVELPGGADDYYDCRFDFVPSYALVDAFTTFSVDRDTVATNVRAVNDGVGACPSTLGELPADATVEVLALNVGDTGFNDTGASGYLDNVVVDVAGSTTIYDFELAPGGKDECKSGGWQAFGFANQGSCVASVQANERAGK